MGRPCAVLTNKGSVAAIVVILETTDDGRRRSLQTDFEVDVVGVDGVCWVGGVVVL